MDVFLHLNEEVVFVAPTLSITKSANTRNFCQFVFILQTLINKFDSHMLKVGCNIQNQLCFSVIYHTNYGEFK